MSIWNPRIGPQILAAGIGSLIFIGTGYHFGWASPSLAKLQAEDSDISVTSDQGSWIASFVLVGSIPGSLIGVPIVNYWGRKSTLLLTTVPMILSCVLIAFAKAYWWLYLARFIAGLSLGIIYVVAPMYLGEIANDDVRGGFGVLIIVMMNSGNLIPYLIGPWTSRATLASVGAIVPLIYLVTFIWMPESPYFYAEKNDLSRAEESLMWLRGTRNVAEEMKIIQSNVANERRNKPSVREILTDKANLKALGIVSGLVTFQQLSGSTAFTSYSTIIFDEVDSGISSSVSVIITGLVQFVSAIGIVFLADKAGRKPLLLTSLSLCIVCLLAGASYFQLRAMGMDVKSISWLPIASMIGFLISYSVGIGTVPMAMTVEIFSCEIKAFGIMIGTLYLCGFGICVTKLYQIVMDAYGIHIAFYLFAVCCVIGIFFVIFAVPETKGRSFSEIQNMLNGRSRTKL